MQKLTDRQLLAKYHEGVRTFSEFEMDNGDLRDCTLPGISFENCILVIDFRNAKLQKASFRNCNIKTCDFREADLSEAKFENVSLDGAEFEGAKGDGTIFRNNYRYGTTLQQEDFAAWIAPTSNANEH